MTPQQNDVTPRGNSGELVFEREVSGTGKVKMDRCQCGCPQRVGQAWQRRLPRVSFLGTIATGQALQPLNEAADVTMNRIAELTDRDQHD